MISSRTAASLAEKAREHDHVIGSGAIIPYHEERVSWFEWVGGEFDPSISMWLAD